LCCRIQQRARDHQQNEPDPNSIIPVGSPVASGRSGRALPRLTLQYLYHVPVPSFVERGQDYGCVFNSNSDRRTFFQDCALSNRREHP
jgi:hypothetical protein